MKRGWIIGCLLAALPWTAMASEDFSAVQKALGIPLSVARVTDASSEGRPSVILIQDVHRHPQAQHQIASMILYGLGQWGTKEIYIEGSWSDEYASKSAALRFPEVSEVLTRRHDFRFMGLEDAEIYRQNVAAYNQVQGLKADALRELRTAMLLGRIVDRDHPTSWDLLQKLVELRLKPSEHADYLQHPFHSEADTALSKAARAAEQFYALANERSRIFLAKAQETHHKGTQVLVVGGFHTAEMASLLRAKGTSYVVLAPHLTRGGYEDLYNRSMQETVSALKLR